MPLNWTDDGTPYYVPDDGAGAYAFPNSPDVVIGGNGQPTRITVRPNLPVDTGGNWSTADNVSLGTQPALATTGPLDVSGFQQPNPDSNNLATVDEAASQFWPYRTAKSALTLGHDVMSGNVLSGPGLRREDVTDIPPSTEGQTALGKLLDLYPVQAQPLDPLMERAQDIASVAGGAPLVETPGVGSVGSGAMRMYHGTSKPGFAKFNEPNSSEFMIDRALGVHVSKDPEIANSFATDRAGQRVENGAVYPVDIPDNAKFLEVEQPLLPYIEDKTTPKNARNVHSDQSQIEQLVMKTAFQKDPELLARYLVQARGVKSMEEALPLAKDMAAGKKVELPIDGKDYDIDRFVRNFGGRPYNKEDSAKAVDLFKQDMKDKGYAGIKYINTSPMETANAKDPTSYIIFEPHKHIKNALTGTLMSDTSKPGAALSALEKAPVFYSAVENAVKNAKQPVATADQWLGYLRNQPGVKQEELDWTLHNLPEGKITKQELEQHIADNKVELKEVNKGSINKPVRTRIDQINQRLEDIQDQFDSYYGGNTPAVINARKELANEQKTLKKERNKLINSLDDMPTTKYSNWQLPGGDPNSYREMLLSLPRKTQLAEESKTRIKELVIDNERLLVAYHNAIKNNETDYALSLHKQMDINTKVIDNIRNVNKEEGFQSSHWDEPNVLAHIRMNDRTIQDPSGNGGPLHSAHIEEIQSDWHQKGRKEGYKFKDKATENKWNAIDKKIIDSNDEAVMGNPDLNEALKLAVDKKIITSDEAKLYNTYRLSQSTIPDAPFKSSWADLALKRIIRKAAEEGKDAISWTPGEAQAARYDLSKHIKEIEYIEYPAGSGDKEKSYRLGITDHKGQGVDTPQFAYTAKELPDVVGKEVADKIINGEGKKYRGHEGRTLDNLDLKIGGEGMKAFYDKMLVDKMSSLIKKYGGKVEESTTDNGHKVYVVKLNDKIKDVALGKGFPLFSGNFMLTPTSENPFEQKGKYKLTPVGHDPWKTSK